MLSGLCLGRIVPSLLQLPLIIISPVSKKLILCFINHHSLPYVSYKNGAARIPKKCTQLCNTGNINLGTTLSPILFVCYFNLININCPKKHFDILMFNVELVPKKCFLFYTK